MTIDKKYIDQIIKVSSKAAYASSLLVGKNDKIAADKAAVDAMRTELNMLDMNGKVVIGEGELDEAPMLYIGEILGTKKVQISILQLILLRVQILLQKTYQELYLL